MLPLPKDGAGAADAAAVVDAPPKRLVAGAAEVVGAVPKVRAGVEADGPPKLKEDAADEAGAEEEAEAGAEKSVGAAAEAAGPKLRLSDGCEAEATVPARAPNVGADAVAAEGAVAVPAPKEKRALPAAPLEAVAGGPAVAPGADAGKSRLLANVEEGAAADAADAMPMRAGAEAGAAPAAAVTAAPPKLSPAGALAAAEEGAAAGAGASFPAAAEAGADATPREKEGSPCVAAASPG